jgi:ribosome biogenesis GTPase
MGAAPGLAARVISAHRLGYVVAGVRGVEEAVLPGRLRKRVAAGELDEPAVGDWLVLDPPGVRPPRVIAALLPRQNRVVRREPGNELKGQVMAANLDLGIVVDSVADELRARRLERFVALLRDAEVPPLIVLTKADLATDPAAVVESVRSLAGDAEVIVVSNLTGENIEQVRDRIPAGSTAGMFGPSGVGKSSLLNQLRGDSRMRVGDVDAEGRGRHTTTHRELLQLPWGALLLDMPGIRELGLWNADDPEETFDDIAAVAAQCRFRDCAHHREPGCAVRAAADSGAIDPARLANWRKLREEREARERVLPRRRGVR